jgi:hypothetical protein
MEAGAALPWRGGTSILYLRCCGGSGHRRHDSLSTVSHSNPVSPLPAGVLIAALDLDNTFLQHWLTQLYVTLHVTKVMNLIAA